MKYTNNFRLPVIALLAIFLLALTSCQKTTTPSPELITPDYPTSRPLCSLRVPKETPHWRQVWRTDYGAGGVRDMIRDGEWLWIVTPTDVVRLNLRTLNCTRFAIGKVQSLLLDPNGHLWAAGSKRLARFDGQRWQFFPTDKSSFSLAFDTAGNLWAEVGLLRGIGMFRYSGHEPPEDGPWEGELVSSPRRHTYDCDRWLSRSGEFRSPEECTLLANWRERLHSLSPPEGIAPWGDNLPPIAAENDEHLWMLAHRNSDNPRLDALLHFDGQNWQISPWPYGSARLVADETRGGVWAGTSEGLVFSDGRSTQKYLLAPGDAVPLGPPVYELTVDSDGHLWASTNSGVLRYDETADTWQPSELKEKERALISADDRGGLWAVSYAGVSHFDRENWTHTPFPKRWPCHPPTDILADVGGGLWLSSNYCALRGFNGEVWDEYDSGSRGDLLARGPGGTVYAATRDGVVKRYDGHTWKTLSPVIGLPRHMRFTQLTIGPKGEIWVVLDDSTPALCLGNTWREFPELADERVTALLIDSRGDVWAGHSQGLLRYDGKTWKRIERKTPFLPNALAEDRQGRIWMGGRDGLIVYDPGK